MITYIITRFSIYDPDAKVWRLTRNNNPNQIKKKLFRKPRLDARFDFFSKVTLPSINKQTNQNYLWYIYASSFLPPNYQNKLLELTKSNLKIKVIFIDSMKEFAKIDYPESGYCTMRLDDDDGLSPNFIELMNKYKNKKGKVISFPNGKRYKLEDGKIILGEEYIYKNASMGLTAIEMDIYQCGNHHNVNKRYPTIYNNQPNMYMAACGKYSDSGRGFKK